LTDLADAIAFYQAAFSVTYNSDISSFQFGIWPADDFFLLTVAHQANEHGEHHGPTGI
jgi:predicted enzyme related to lactoylglutathione lyase